MNKRRSVPVSEVPFLDLMALEGHGPDTFIGLAPKYPWGRLFGGQVVAQGLRAAQLTVDDSYRAHSLHGYFIRGGTHREPVRFEVDRIRNGRSFLTRRVVARQSSGAILNLSCSFQVAEDEADVQTVPFPDDVPPPESVEDTGWGDLMRRRTVRTEAGRTLTWLRLETEPLPDLALTRCALAFLSDSVPSGSVRSAHPIQVPRSEIPKTFTGASLDHAVYFQRPDVDPRQWLLADVTCHGLVGGRGLSVGNIFDASGTQVMSVVQEVLLRVRRERPEGATGS